MQNGNTRQQENEQAHERLEEMRETSWYENVYKAGVYVKGFDGLVELLAGLWLLVAPSSLHGLLRLLFGEAVEHPGSFMRFIAEHIAHIDAELTRGGLLIVVLFLISHGIVKIVLVYCLIKELLWAYPYALVVLGGFLVYQVYLFIVHPTISMGLFAALDAIIIWLVWGEWKKLQYKKRNQDATPAH